MTEMLPGLYRNQTVTDLTETALQAAGMRDYAAAAGHMEEAASVLGNEGKVIAWPNRLPRQRPGHRFDGSEVQRAEVEWLRARVDMSHALQLHSAEDYAAPRNDAAGAAESAPVPNPLETAAAGQERIDLGRVLLEPFVSGRQVLFTAATKAELADGAAAARGWSAAHTAGREARDTTLDTLARLTATHASLGCAALVLTGRLSADKRPADQNHIAAEYGLAHALAQTGETAGEIALLALRAERASGRMLHAGQWAGRLVGAYARIITREANLTSWQWGWRNMRRAVSQLTRQSFDRLPELTSRAAAIDALVHPTRFDLIEYPEPDIPGESYDDN